MLPKISSRFTKSQQSKERSPFSSPNSNLHASPIAARRSSLEERRRPAAYFDHPISPGPTDGIDDQDQDEEEEEEEEEDNQEEALDEDEAGEMSPLLPIFSAAHLGRLALSSRKAV